MDKEQLNILEIYHTVISPFYQKNALNLTTLYLFFWINHLSGQVDSSQTNKIRNPVVFELEAESGGILIQKGLENTTYKNANFQGAQLRLGWKQTDGNDVYNHIYNYPIYGIGFFTGNLNNGIIGNPYAIYGFMEVPLKIGNGIDWDFNYRIGLGLSGNFRPFNKIDNPLNLVIGTRNNVYIDFAFRAQYKLAPHWKIGFGLSFHHFSNGALVLPNKGVNLIPLTLSINYQPDVSSQKYSQNSDKEQYIKKINKGWFYDINYGLGLKQLHEDNDTKYFKSSLGIFASKNVSSKWRIGGGVDIFYSSSGNEKEIAGDKSGNFSSKISGGPSLYIVHTLHDKLLLNGNIGYYIHNQRFNGEISNFFLRAGFRYYVYKNFNAGVSIKAHMGKADFIEWTLGYTFNH